MSVCNPLGYDRLRDFFYLLHLSMSKVDQNISIYIECTVIISKLQTSLELVQFKC